MVIDKRQGGSASTKNLITPEPCLMKLRWNKEALSMLPSCGCLSMSKAMRCNKVMESNLPRLDATMIIIMLNRLGLRL